VHKYIIAFILICLFTARGDDFQTWEDARIFYWLDQKWQLDGEIGTRGIIAEQDWDRFHFIPAVSYYYRLNMILRGGIQWIYTSDQLASNTFEIRPWQGIRIIWPQTSFIYIEHYGRLEERLHFSETGYSGRVAMRFRYRFQAKTPNLKIAATGQTIYILANIELFAEAGKTLNEIFTDNRRLVFGVGFFITQPLSTELHYIRQTSLNSIEESYSDLVHIIRLRIRYDWN
jgi:hypothetical protein